VGLVALVPLILITGPEVPIKSVKDLVAMAKAKPGEVTYASFGTGSAGHLAGELFCSMTGTNMQHIPFKGSAPAIADVMGGRVTIMFPGIGSAVPLVNGGKLKALAVTTAQRASAAPDVPTVEESGVPGYVVSTWESILAPAGTPPEVVAKLNKALAEAMAAKEVREKMIALGLEPDGTKNPAQTAQFIRAEMAKWARVVKERGVKVE
jgi:tripartite-type tricarboxylate transporter receptor subunit TctC